MTQGKKFDPKGDYVRRFVPELASVGADKIHEPWLASGNDSTESGYPGPIVELPASRARALAAFKALSGG